MADPVAPKFINPHHDIIFIPREKQAGSYEVRPWSEKVHHPQGLYIVEGTYFEQFANKGQLATFREPAAAPVAPVPVTAGGSAPVGGGTEQSDGAPPAGGDDGDAPPAGAGAGDPGEGEDVAGSVAGGNAGTPASEPADAPPVDAAPKPNKPKKPGRA